VRSASSHVAPPRRLRDFDNQIIFVQVMLHYPGVHPSSRGRGSDAESPPVASAIIDCRGAVVGWSPQAHRLTGYAWDEVRGRPGALLVEPQGAAEIASWIGEGHRSRPAWSGGVAIRHRGGAQIAVELHVSPLDGGDLRGGFLVLGIAEGAAPWAGAHPSSADRIMAISPVGICVFDVDLRLLWINDELRKSMRISPQEQLGRRLSETLPGAAGLEAAMGGVLESGKPTVADEYVMRIPLRPHKDSVFTASISLLDEPVGTRVCCVLVDITDRVAARERMTLFADANERLGATLDVLHAAQALTEVAVPRLADFVFVDLYEPVLRGDDHWSDRDPISGLRRCGQHSTREGCPESAYRLHEQVRPRPDAPDARALATGAAVLESRVDPSSAWIDPRRAVAIRRFGLRSVLSVPIRTSCTVLGVASFVRTAGRDDDFEAEDVRLVKDFVNRAAVCIDNARRYTRERFAALTLQRTLLPRGLSRAIPMDVATRYLPADVADGVGGDWFDVIVLSGARVALVVGDVVGHGLTAAVTMGRLRTAVRTLADMDLRPDELLAHLDDLVTRLAEEDDAASGDAESVSPVLGVTCVVAVYDPVEGRCVMARAGHPPPLIVLPDGEVAFPDLPAGLPLGLGMFPFESAQFDLPPGSMLALFTDGLVEARDRDIESGINKLAGVLAGRGLPLEEVCDRALGSMLDGDAPDDVALLLVRTQILGAQQVATWDLSRDPAVVGTARALALRQAADWGLDDLGFCVELIVSELVTNAIRHATGPIQLRLIRHEVLTCEVSDGSSSSPRLRHPRATDEGGRGLFLVAQVARRWGTRGTATGKTIWAELDIPAAP
jgi:PAS domain S-box-containing protein